MPEPIFITTPKGDKIRILNPEEFDKFIKAIPNIQHRTLFNIAFYTGMRYIEIQRLYLHQEWWQKDRNVIYLPREAQLKQRRTTPERYVPIAPQIQGELAYFFKNKKPPHRNAWTNNLKRWAVKAGLVSSGYYQDAIGISLKMTRASLETWMVIAGYPLHHICLRQGHDKLTSLNHYQALNMAFLPIEKEEIKRRIPAII